MLLSMPRILVLKEGWFLSAGDAAAPGASIGASGVAAAERTARTAEVFSARAVAGVIAEGERAAGDATAETGSGAGKACGVKAEGAASAALSPGVNVVPSAGPETGLSDVCSEIFGTFALDPASAETATPARAGRARLSSSNTRCMT